jgi:hypothetical protein
LFDNNNRYLSEKNKKNGTMDVRFLRYEEKPPTLEDAHPTNRGHRWYAGSSAAPMVGHARVQPSAVVLLAGRKSILSERPTEQGFETC